MIANAPNDEAMFACRGVSARHGRLVAAHDISLSVGTSEVVALLGPNGAGKTSAVECFAGRVAGTGSIILDGAPIDSLATHERIRAGLSFVPENRGLFADLSVDENLLLGLESRKSTTSDVSAAYDLFPALKDRSGQTAGTMSGGEQQMLAIGRAIVAQPKFLILDEPTQGLAPVILDAIIDAIFALKGNGLSILLVEQSVGFAARVADRYYVLSGGRLVAEGGGQGELDDPTALFERYIAS